MIDLERPPFDMTDMELDELDRLSRQPERWPAEYRQCLPVIRDLVVRWQQNRAIAPGQLTTEQVASRIGAHI